MKFTELWIDGYGRFSGKHVELAPGLQIIAGPNEQGKSTIRHFISDMLYGQKRSSTQRQYDDANETRTPWNPANGYGGRIAYVLDSGKLIEVSRIFDRDREAVKVFNITDGEDVTPTFPMQKNRELAFAEAHLDMNKSVFLGMATIAHGTLEDLGDKNALSRIREKLISLSDSGNVKDSTETAMKWLSDRIASIGQPAARTKPLPTSRAHLVDLQKESEQVHLIRQEARALERERLAVLNEIDGLLNSKAGLEADLRGLEKRERADRLRKAEDIERRMDEATKACFSLGAARDFPLAGTAETQRAGTLVHTAEQQLVRMKSERDALGAQLETESMRLGEQRPVSTNDGDPEHEAALAEYQTEIRRLRDRLEESEKSRIAAEDRCAEAQNSLSKLPDFSQTSSDPVEWLTQLASSFSVAQRARDSEQAQLDRILEAAEAKKTNLLETSDIFDGCDNFLDLLTNYESNAQESEDSIKSLRRASEEYRQDVEELKSRVPGFTIAAGLSFAFMGLLIGAALYTGNLGIYLPAGITALMVIYFSGSVLLTRRAAEKRLRELHLIEHERENALKDTLESRDSIELLMVKSKSQNIRELEALYERFKHDQTEMALLEEQRADQEVRAKEARDRVLGMLERLRTTFLRVGEKVDAEDGVQGAAMRAMARYQEYRDAKRRSVEQREIAERERKTIEALAESLEALRKKELTLSLQVRQFLRDNDFLEETRHENALDALRAYKLRNAKLRQGNSQVDVIRAKLDVIEKQIDAEETELTKNRETLDKYLNDARVSSLDEYVERAEQAKGYEDNRRMLSALEEQLSTLLAGEDIKDLRAAVAADDVPSTTTNRKADELRRELHALGEALEVKQKQAHDLQLEITERSAGMRSVNEIDEERDAVERMVQELELELQAAGYAMSVLDEVTRERHSQIAPVLAERASGYLSEITEGAYNELLVNRDMKISVRIPETRTFSDDPERRLSKGTVDQIYLSLRLAMVQCASENDEKVPMLLDDPFANYDDARLFRAMKLLQKVGQTNQVLLFTCRQDVVAAGKMVGAPILSL